MKRIVLFLSLFLFIFVNKTFAYTNVNYTGNLDTSNVCYELVMETQTGNGQWTVWFNQGAGQKNGITYEWPSSGQTKIRNIANDTWIDTTNLSNGTHTFDWCFYNTTVGKLYVDGVEKYSESMSLESGTNFTADVYYNAGSPTNVGKVPNTFSPTPTPTATPTPTPTPSVDVSYSYSHTIDNGIYKNGNYWYQYNDAGKNYATYPTGLDSISTIDYLCFQGSTDNDQKYTMEVKVGNQGYQRINYVYYDDIRLDTSAISVSGSINLCSLLPLSVQGRNNLTTKDMDFRIYASESASLTSPTLLYGHISTSIFEPFDIYTASGSGAFIGFTVPKQECGVWQFACDAFTNTLEFIVNLFIPNFDTQSISDRVALINTKVPFGYINAVIVDLQTYMVATASDPAQMNFTIPITTKEVADAHGMPETMTLTTDTSLNDFRELFRNLIAFLLWGSFFMYLLFRFSVKIF